MNALTGEVAESMVLILRCDRTGLNQKPQLNPARRRHQPGLGRLLATCLPGGVGAEAFEFRKMGVALLCFQGAARAGCGRLIWLLPPRILRAAG